MTDGGERITLVFGTFTALNKIGKEEIVWEGGGGWRVGEGGGKRRTETFT